MPKIPLALRRQNRQRGAMSQRPVLGIIACNRTVGTEIAQTVINRYATAAMRHADCAALIIPSLPEHMPAAEILWRTGDRRGGKECGNTGRSWGSQEH